MPKKRPKLALLAEQIAVARRIISDQQAFLGSFGLAESLRAKPKERYEHTLAPSCI